jgi:hypothetical protein
MVVGAAWSPRPNPSSIQDQEGKKQTSRLPEPAAGAGAARQAVWKVESGQLWENGTHHTPGWPAHALSALCGATDYSRRR